MREAVPVDPVCAIEVAGSGRPGRVEATNPGATPASAGAPAVEAGGSALFESFNELLIAAGALARRVRQVTAGGGSLAELEQAVHEKLLAVGAAAVQDGLNMVSAGEVRRHDVTGPEGAPRPWADPGRARTLTTLFGDVTFTRIAYRGPGVPDVFCADEALDLPAGPHYSRALEARTAHLEALLPYRQVREVLEWETGVRIHNRQLREIAARVAADTATFAQTRAIPEPADTPEPAGVDGAAPPPGGPARGRVLVLTFDGKGVIMRREALRTSERPDPGPVRVGAGLPGHQQSGGRRGRKRLAELSCVYDIQADPRTIDDIMDALAARTSPPNTKTTTAARATARARWLQASLTDGIDQVVTDAFAQADRRDPTHHHSWLVLVDGNKSQIDAARAQAAARDIHVPILIDLLHVLGYLGDAANATFNPGAPAAQSWFLTQTRALLEGHADQVADQIRDRADRFRCTGTERAKALAAATYLDNHLDYLDYPTALAAGWPIATGVIEGACKNLVCDRADVSGARWGLDGAGHILALRALVITDSYAEYTTHHLTRQHARQYPKHTPAAA